MIRSEECSGTFSNVTKLWKWISRHFWLLFTSWHGAKVWYGLHFVSVKNCRVHESTAVRRMSCQGTIWSKLTPLQENQRCLTANAKSHILWRAEFYSYLMGLEARKSLRTGLCCFVHYVLGYKVEVFSSIKTMNSHCWYVMPGAWGRDIVPAVKACYSSSEIESFGFIKTWIKASISSFVYMIGSWCQFHDQFRRRDTQTSQHVFLYATSCWKW